MADFNLGTARGTIEIDYNGNDAARRAGQDINGIRGSSEQAGASLNKVANGAGIAGIGIVAGFGLAVNAAANFEKGLSGIAAVSGATTSQMDAVSKKALQLGADTAFSASDAAGAMEELVKAGITIPDVLNGAADSVVSLAAAGGIELPAAATIAANAMNQFGLSADEMPKIADKIAGAANSSAIDVSDFGNSMAQVGSVAHLTGLSFDDTALAITAMGNAGVKGSDAGTSLKTFLMGLQPQTKKQIALMDELGITTKGAGNKFYDASGKVKSMSEIAGVLGTSLKGMSDKQKTATLETLFGTDAIRAAASIAGTGAKGMDKLTASIDKTKAADVAKVRLGNMKGGMEALKGSAETFAIQIGSVLIPMLTSFIGKITSVINWFTQLDDGTKKFIVIAGLFVAAFLLIIAVMIKVALAIKAVKAAQIALNLTFLANPITWIILAIVALIAAFVLLYKNNKSFREFVDKMWAAIKTAISSVVTWITGTAVPWLVAAWQAIANGAQALWAKIVSVWNAIVSGITTAVNAVKSVISAVFGFIVLAITTYVKLWLLIITTVFNAIKSVITTVLNVIKGIWTSVWGLFGPLVKAVWDLIVALISLAIRAVLLVIRTVLTAIKTAWTVAWNAIKAVGSAVWNAIKTAITTVFNAIKAVVTRIVTSVKTTITAAWNLIKSVTTTVWNAIKAAVSGPLNAIKSFVAQRIANIKANVTTVWNAIKSVTSTVWNAVKSAVTGPINAVKSTVSSVVSTIKNAVSTAWNSVKSKTSEVWNALKGIVSTAINGVMTKVGEIKGKVLGFFSGAGGWLKDAGSQLIGGLAQGIRDAVGKVTSAISGITAKVKGFLPGSPIKEGPLLDWNKKRSGGPGAKLVEFLAEGIGNNRSAVEDAFRGMTVGMPTVLGSSNVALNASASRMGASWGSSDSVQPSVPALVGGDLVLQAAAGQSVESQFDSVMFRLRTTKGASR